MAATISFSLLVPQQENNDEKTPKYEGCPTRQQQHKTQVCLTSHMPKTETAYSDMNAGTDGKSTLINRLVYTVTSVATGGLTTQPKIYIGTTRTTPNTFVRSLRSTGKATSFQYKTYEREQQNRQRGRPIPSTHMIGPA